MLIGFPKDPYRFPAYIRSSWGTHSLFSCYHLVVGRSSSKVLGNIWQLFGPSCLVGPVVLTVESLPNYSTVDPLAASPTTLWVFWTDESRKTPQIQAATFWKKNLTVYFWRCIHSNLYLEMIEPNQLKKAASKSSIFVARYSCHKTRRFQVSGIPARQPVACLSHFFSKIDPRAPGNHFFATWNSQPLADIPKKSVG